MSGGRELLVFDHRDHPEAGTQVPAGGVDPGELLTHAVQREVREETGVAADAPIAVLAVQRRPHPQTSRPPPHGVLPRVHHRNPRQLDAYRRRPGGR
ncbi:NUDIX domain-containing protein [Streptomyces sp. NPDC048305]|uniref:NUDIX domain-containing protein n=1 Tax=Streptomyces sp. NPDC048305 TaxID=3365532 RepID=UPI003713061A